MEDLSNITTWKQLLENTFKGKRVKIVLGHHANSQYIIGTVKGFEDGSSIPSDHEHSKTYILLGEVTTNSPFLKDVINEGKFDRHYLRISDQIEIHE